MCLGSHMESLAVAPDGILEFFWKSMNVELDHSWRIPNSHTGFISARAGGEFLYSRDRMSRNRFFCCGVGTIRRSRREIWPSVDVSQQQITPSSVDPPRSGTKMKAMATTVSMISSQRGVDTIPCLAVGSRYVEVCRP